MIRNTTGIIQGNDNTTILANYLKNAEIQYPVLSKKQEQELIQKYKHDRDKLNSLLIMHNAKAVFNIAKKYKSKTNDFDSLIHDGFLGLAEAAKRFDINKNIKFLTYAYIWIRKYILSSFYAKNIEVDKASISLECFSAQNSTSTLSDNSEFIEYVNQYIDPVYAGIIDVDDEVTTQEQNELCADLMRDLDKDTSLSSLDKEVFIDIFYNKEKTADIADKYDISRSEVNNIKHRVLVKCKNILKTNYNITSYSQLK